MKALSIKEPWASLILTGEKTIEIRSWATSFRGKFLVCVSRFPKSELSGFAICTAELIDIQPMSKKFIKPACIQSLPNSVTANMIKSHYAWVITNIKPIHPPFPIKGKLRFFDVAFYRK